MFGEGFDDPMFGGGAGKMFVGDYRGQTRHWLEDELGANKGIIPRCISTLFQEV